MRNFVHRAATVHLVLAAAFLATGCSDVVPTQAGPETKARKYIEREQDVYMDRLEPGMVDYSDGVSQDESYTISEPYQAQSPLAPFGVHEGDFFNNPEAVTDAQFGAEANYSVPESEVGPIETDQSNVESYTSTCDAAAQAAGSATSPFLYAYSGRCERLYNSCVARCRRMWNPRSRALCYAACMSSYAGCLRGWW